MHTETIDGKAYEVVHIGGRKTVSLGQNHTVSVSLIVKVAEKEFPGVPLENVLTLAGGYEGEEMILYTDE